MTGVATRRPVVLIFKENLLPLSETFIAAQTGQLSAFEGRFVGLGEASPSLPVPSDAILLTRGQSGRANYRQKLYRRIGFAPNFHKQAAKVQASLIHAHFASGGRSALPLAKTLRLPLLVTLHGSDVTTRIDFAARYGELWKRAAGFICVSEFIRRKAAEAGFPAEKLTVQYIGIDRDLFRADSVEPSARRNVVLFVGRLVEKKGCSHMLRAMVEVQKQHPEVKTIVIGGGPLREALTLLAGQLGVRCQFLGPQPPRVVRECLGKVRVFCAPSVTAANGDSEGLGMVFAEAQAMGTPVASFHHGGIPEVVVNGQTGLLAPEGDVDGLAVNLSQLLDDSPVWTACARAAITWVAKRFDIRTQTAQLETLYTRSLPAASVGFPDRL